MLWISKHAKGRAAGKGTGRGPIFDKKVGRCAKMARHCYKFGLLLGLRPPPETPGCSLWAGTKTANNVAGLKNGSTGFDFL